ncbi:MAG: ABC transporter substrate-binding protein [Patescibacteria group bacterium]|nr:ABC transporter substrate-binding protein [Patescibacteria group bacterium]
MILLGKRRLIFWLFRAYLKKWRKTILASFLFGLLVFTALYLGWGVIVPEFPFNQRMVVGMVGSYNTDNIPVEVLRKASSGLTVIDKDGKPKPDIALSWNIKDNGKTYIFYLKRNIYFSDGENLTSSSINYNFLDVKVETPQKYTIVFKLKDNYSPFLVTVSQPIFKKGLIGVGEYKISSIDVSGSFVNSITLVSNKVKNKTLTFQFYPTQNALKNAFVIGDIDKTVGLEDANFNNTSFYAFRNARVTKSIDYGHLVTLFYNTQNRTLSDKRLREALSYAVPDSFSQGKRSYVPYPPDMWTYQAFDYQKDYTHAKLLLSQSQSASESATMEITLEALPQYEQVAKAIARSWQNIGVNTKIKIVQTLPVNFQAFLGDFRVPKDPDQYTLWHSGQMNNITNYKSLRIDKLLEDGRQTVDVSSRLKIYSDFQKYLLDDAPATFLYFPNSYTVTRNSAVQL